MPPELRRGAVSCALAGHTGRRKAVSFLKRLILSICLLLVLGVPLSATYYDTAQSLPARADKDQPVGQDDGAPAGDNVPGAPVPADEQEKSTG